MTRIQTKTTHTPAQLIPPMRLLSRATNRATVSALRQHGSEATDGAQRSGSSLDTSRLWGVSQGLPDPRPFSRTVMGNDRTPSLGLTILVDASGSMRSHDEDGTTGNPLPYDRLTIAAGMACGMVAACESLQIPVQIGHHGEQMGMIQLRAHMGTRSVITQPQLSGNVDAYAVWQWLERVPPLAQRNLFVLICDGAPTTEQKTMSRECIARMARQNTAFVCAFIGGESSGVRSCVQDWGALRVANCGTSPAALTRTIIHALRALRGGTAH